MTDLAIEKLKQEKGSGTFDRYADLMKESVCEALIGFCRQDQEFAQAVYQGGSFTECMKAVARNCGKGISDLEAYRRAVQFYFKGADIRFRMEINLCAAAEAAAGITEERLPAPGATESGKVVHLDLDSFL